MPPIFFVIYTKKLFHFRPFSDTITTALSGDVAQVVRAHGS